MNGSVLMFLGAGVTALWGIAHLMPTKSVVAGFGDISHDNRQIITMEWIVEGVALILIGALVATVTWIDPTSPAATAVFWLCSLGLVALAVVSLFTGFRVRFLPFRLCPVVLTASAVLIVAGGLL